MNGNPQPGETKGELIRLIAMGFCLRCTEGSVTPSLYLPFPEKSHTIARSFLTSNFHSEIVKEALLTPDYYLIKCLKKLWIIGKGTRGDKFLLDVLLPNKDFGIFIEWIKNPKTAPAAVSFLAEIEMRGTCLKAFLVLTSQI